jgi:hypothetical protein
MSVMVRARETNEFTTEQGCKVSGFTVFQKVGSTFFPRVEHVTLEVPHESNVIEISGRFKKLDV